LLLELAIFCFQLLDAAVSGEDDQIYGVTVDVSGDLIKDDEAELRLVMTRQ